jgi:hypothetical protein
LQSTEGGKPREFTPEGMIYCTVSPSGSILAVNEEHRAFLYPSDSSNKAEKEFTLDAGESPSGWTADGQFLYLSQMQQRPMSVTRLEIATGRRQFWKRLPDLPENTELKCETAVITPDGQSYAYTYSRHQSDLYLVQGAK